MGVTPAADVYMAARCAIYLSGGDPLSDKMPSGSAPKDICRLIESCLLEAPSMRPSDCWTFHDEFNELLKKNYGKSRYLVFHMT